MERTTAGCNEREKFDGETGGDVPYGYRRELAEPVTTIDDQAATVVRRIVARRDAGASLRAIASELEQDRIASPRGAAGFASGVQQVLDNAPAYHADPRNDSPVHWPAIRSSR